MMKFLKRYFGRGSQFIVAVGVSTFGFADHWAVFHPEAATTILPFPFGLVFGVCSGMTAIGIGAVIVSDVG